MAVAVPAVAQVLVLTHVVLFELAIESHLREADHRVERGPQLVRHAGQELGFVVAGDLELAGLRLQLPEQARVDYGQGRLPGKRLEQFDMWSERARAPAPDHQDAQDPLAAQNGN